MLVFLPGEREIRDTADALRRRSAAHRLEVVPLYSRLSAAEQHRVFAPHTRGRRVVLATNVAETSLTVPGIRYVVDTGVARISRYSVRTKVQRLPIEPISQASANQRSGRCGRRRAGHRDPALLRGGLRGPPGVHRPGDPAHQPGQRHPPDGLAAARRHRPVPVRRAARQAQRHAPASSCSRSSGALGRPRRRSERGRLDARSGRRLARLPIDPRLAPDDPRGRAPRLRARGDRDRGRAVAAGPARAPGRAAGAGRPAARPLQGRGQRLPHLAQPVALPQAAAARAVVAARSAGCASASTSTTCGSASGRTSSPSCARSARRWRSRSGQPADTPGRGRHPPGAARPGLLSHIGAARGARPKDAGRGERRPMREYLGARGARFAIFPGSGLQGKQPAVPDGRRAGRDLAAVGAAERRDQARVGRAARRPPGQAHATPSRTGRASGPP